MLFSGWAIERQTQMARAMNAGKAVYFEVSADWVDPRHRALAESCLKVASDDLGIRVPPIRWFVPWLDARLAARGDWWDREGFAWDGNLAGAASELGAYPSVWLRAGLTPSELMRTAAHEVKHIEQGLVAGADREAEAQAYEDEFFAMLRAAARRLDAAAA